MIFNVRTVYVNEQDIRSRRSVVAKRDIPLDSICSFEQVVNNKLKILKTKCLLICEAPIGSVVVEKSFERVKDIMEEHRKSFFIKGFIRYD